LLPLPWPREGVLSERLRIKGEGYGLKRKRLRRRGCKFLNLRVWILIERDCMRIHSEIVKLNYNPATDVLSVEWPDIHGYNVEEIRAALGDIVLNIRNFGVRRLLVDSRKAVISISNGEYDRMTTQCIKELVASPIEKVARIESGDAAREAWVAGLVKARGAAIAFRNFATREEAVKWLELGVYRF
jgi:hypothetical protein